VQNDIRKFEVSAKKNKNFYAHVKSKTKGKSNKIGPVYDKNGKLQATKKGMTDAETNRETSGFDPLLITVLFQIRT
jgi:hypothetical protein